MFYHVMVDFQGLSIGTSGTAKPAVLCIGRVPALVGKCEEELQRLVALEPDDLAVRGIDEGKPEAIETNSPPMESPGVAPELTPFERRGRPG